MNQRGVFLTLMVFVVGIVVVGLAISHAGTQKERESLLSESTARERVDEQFNEAYYALSDLLQNESIAKDRARVLPFKYSVDTDMVWLRQTMPIENEKFDEFNDYLNLYELFWKKKGDLNTNFSFEAIKNNLWLPGAEKPRFPAYEFKALPQCVIYRLDQQDNNYGRRGLVIKKGNPSENNCEFDRQWYGNGRDWLKNAYEIQKIIVNIHSDRNYTGMPKCKTASEFQYNVAGECWRKPFDENRGWPYGEINFFAKNDLNASVYNHYNPDPSVAKQQIDFNLAGQLPGKDQNIVFGGNEILRIDMSGINPAAVVTVDVNIFFRRPIEAFLLENLSISVENVPFRIRRLSLDQNQIGYCGDFNCAAPLETKDNCPQDCTCIANDQPGNCQPWENVQTCGPSNPFDCRTNNDGICSDGGGDIGDCGCSKNTTKAPSCDPGEHIGTCSKDCAWTCGNGRCDTGETNIQGIPNTYYCPQDCPRNCTDTCSPNGAWECVGINGRHQCGYYGGACLKWGLALVCPPGQTCSGGSCVGGAGGGDTG